MADEDFEIDVYGDADANANTDVDAKIEDVNTQAYDSNSSITIANGSNPSEPSHHDTNAHAHAHSYDAQGNQNMEGHEEHEAPAQQRQQGIKRKGDSENRPIDPGATNCLLLSDLNWWSTDDDIRGWLAQAECEGDLKDITFSEHKVNGKSKGQAYLEFSSQQAATAAKHQIEWAAVEIPQPGGKKPSVIYSSPVTNPFRTLPKDAPARGKDNPSSRGAASGGFNDRGGGSFRGRGNFNGPRGGFNRNFAGGNMGGGGGGGGGGFHPNNNMGGGGFGNSMPGGGNFGFGNMGAGGGNFGFRGGMMGSNMGGGMRGGGMRGGRGGGMGPGMGPAGMNPAVGAAMNGGMMGGMGGMGMPMMGFQQPHFNPAFFGNNQQSDWQNPHGAKRPRGE
ncbi:hypothetical protein GGR50DRAFT_692636 [Xylaria sp. CBS 124048]|nr:hypothetical protein GGR50DRAFT_692636 [Xylaria sp. CBS 124048]